MKKRNESGKMAVTMWIRKDVIEKIDYFVEEGGFTRSRFVANVIEAAVHDLMILNNVGFMRMAKFYYDMRRFVKTKGEYLKGKMFFIVKMNE